MATLVFQVTSFCLVQQNLCSIKNKDLGFPKTAWKIWVFCKQLFSPSFDWRRKGEWVHPWRMSTSTGRLGSCFKSPGFFRTFSPHAEKEKLQRWICKVFSFDNGPSAEGPNLGACRGPSGHQVSWPKTQPLFRKKPKGGAPRKLTSRGNTLAQPQGNIPSPVCLVEGYKCPQSAAAGCRTSGR